MRVCINNRFVMTRVCINNRLFMMRVSINNCFVMNRCVSCHDPCKETEGDEVDGGETTGQSRPAPRYLNANFRRPGEALRSSMETFPG